MIGCGNVAEKKSGPAFNKVDHSTLEAVASRSFDKSKDYAKRHLVPKVYKSVHELINSSSLNAIYIATPPSSHAQLAIDSMRAGKPVYVEKPMATTYKECLEMLKVSKETGIPLFVAYYRRTLPGFLKVKQLLEENTIGKPLAVNIILTRPIRDTEKDGSWRVDKNIAGGGIFYDLASHQFDFLDFLFGPVTNACGYNNNNNEWYLTEDTVTASFKFSNGVIGSGLWSFVTHDKAEKDLMEIIGTEGTISFSGFKHTPIKLIKPEGEIEFPYLNPENIQYNLIKQVVEAIIYNKDCISNGISASRTNKVMEMIIRYV